MTMQHAIIWPLPGDGEETEVRLFDTDEAAVMWAGDHLPKGGWQYARVVQPNKINSPQVREGDVVEVGGMRGIVREVNGDDARVAAGRTDRGVWVQLAACQVVYRHD